MISIETPFSLKIQEYKSAVDPKSKLIPAKDLVELLLRTLNALYLREHLCVDKDLTPPLRSFLSRKWKNPTTGNWEASLEKFRKARMKIQFPESVLWFSEKVEKPYAILWGNPKKDKPPSVLSFLSNLRNEIAHFYSHADSSKIEELSILAQALLDIFKKSPISELKFWREDEKVYCGITEKESFLLSPLFYYFNDGYHFFDGIDFSGNPIYLSQVEGGRKKVPNLNEEWNKTLPLLEWENDIGMTYFAYLKKWEDEYKKSSVKHTIVENEVRKFISKGKQGVLLLRGEIGSGKTILLSSIINKFIESINIVENSIEFIEFIGRGVNLNFLPVRLQDKKKRVFSIDKSFFFAYFFRKVQEITGSKFNLSYPESESSAIQIFPELVKLLEGESKKIVFVIDSVEDLEPVLQDLIPFGLKNSLYIVTTKTTSGEVRVLHEKNVPAKEIFLPVLTPEESEKFLNNELGNEKNLVNEKGMQRILGLTAGNLFFLKIWADSVRIGKIYTGEIPEEILSYYADFFENLRKKERTIDYLRPLTILASAEKKVEESILLSLLKLDKNAFLKVIFPVRHLLREEEGFWSLIHPTFREYLLREYLVPIRKVKETYYLPLMETENVARFPYENFQNFKTELESWKKKQSGEANVYDKSFYRLRRRYNV